ncbi:MAG: sporulation protein YabP [Candidatus Limivicinus sp.]
MAYEQIQKAAARTHSLSMENREKLSLGGVEDVSGFDENLIVLSTSQGQLTIRGEGLHIDRIDLDAGQLEVRGHVQELSYDEPARGGSLWGRLFGG